LASRGGGENLLGEDGLLGLYRASDGLCLQHFCGVLARVHEGRVLEELVAVQRELWEKLEAGLSELIRKSDYRFCGEPMGVEAVSWLRALAVLAGERRGG